MSTELKISWNATTNKPGKPLRDIPPNTFVRDLNYSDGGAYGYWDGEGVIWFYDDHITIDCETDSSLQNCVPVRNATIKIEVEE